MDGNLGVTILLSVESDTVKEAFEPREAITQGGRADDHAQSSGLEGCSTGSGRRVCGEVSRGGRGDAAARGEAATARGL